MKISQILNKIDQNQLFVPAFQREYVWGRDDAKNLIASLIRQYPTGTLLTWDTNSPPELKGSWEYTPAQGTVTLILDGQQRVTTLYLLINDRIPPYYQEHEIRKDPRGMYVNLKTLDLQYYQKSIMAKDPNWVNITDIFQGKLSLRDIVELSRNHAEGTDENLIFDNFTAIANIPSLEFVEQQIPVKASLKEAIDIFYIVNDSGINLTDAELALAQISGYWPQARELFKEKLVALQAHGFDFTLDFIIYCLLGIIYHIGSDMRRLHDSSNNDRLREVWKKLDEEVLDYVVNILHSRAYVDHTKEINSTYALIPMIAYVYARGTKDITATDIGKMVKWFYYSQIRYRYISQLGQRLDKDLGVVARSDNPFDELISIIAVERPLEINPEEFIGATINNPLYSLMRWYFKSRGAVCLTTGVGIRQNMGKKYVLEWDHVFPYSVLRDNGYNINNRHKYSLAQEITNRVVLTQLGNRSKSATAARDYLTAVSEKAPDTLKLQSIPENRELWELDRFEDFLAARRALLAGQLNDFLAATATTSETTGVPLDELISDGENTELEFKASLAWDYREGTENKDLEKVIVKTITAFNNAEGGTLLIGVSDDSEILGLEPDYGILRGNKDEFELHLRDIINTQLGKSFTASAITISFPAVNGQEICRVDVPKGVHEMHLTVTTKDGAKSEKFYVRSGNSSQELMPSEAAAYIKNRF